MKVSGCLSCESNDFLVIGNAGEIVEIKNGIEFIQEAYSLLKCKKCGLYFKDHIASPEDLNTYYNNLDFTIWNPVISYPTESIAEKFLVENIVENSNVLDFGCSEGRFLSKFVERFNCYGYDIDDRAVLLAKKKGIHILSEDEIKEKESFFDVVILSDVFEHSSTPTKLLKDLLQLLNRDGVLIVSTGNADAKPAKFNLADYWYFRTIQHLCMLSEDYLVYLENELNCRILLKEKCSHYDDKLYIKMMKKIKFLTRFFLYKTVSIRKNSFQNNLLKQIPFFKKITKWYTQPFYPFFKDHFVVVFKKKY